MTTTEKKKIAIPRKIQRMLAGERVTVSGRELSSWQRFDESRLIHHCDNRRSTGPEDARLAWIDDHAKPTDLTVSFPYKAEGSPVSRVRIPASEVEFDTNGGTIWIHGPQGATILRIKTLGKIRTHQCETSPSSHADIIVEKDIAFCLSNDAKQE